MEFKGYDWTELAKCFGLFENEYEDELTLKKTKDYLVTNHFSNTEYLAKEIRRFLFELYKNCLQSKRYSTPVWKGLLNIEDDFTLIKYTIILLEYMWY